MAPFPAALILQVWAPRFCTHTSNTRHLVGSSFSHLDTTVDAAVRKDGKGLLCGQSPRGLEFPVRAPKSCRLGAHSRGLPLLPAPRMLPRACAHARRCVFYEGGTHPPRRSRWWQDAGSGCTPRCPASAAAGAAWEAVRARGPGPGRRRSPGRRRAPRSGSAQCSTR